MRNLLTICFVLIVAGLFACRKQDTEFKNFLGDKEVVYPGVVNNPHSRPGNLRTALVWNPSSDPSITKYVVYWNNKTDSVVVQSAKHNPADSITAVIPGLSEYIYSFTVFS
ncbi:MAG: hypothetical protein EOP54_22900, partial [Sphingobacteriales bacterium]